ncbi:MAG: alpha/beta fold hydrolase [Alphaproteobacteria bacterium]
MRTPKKKSAKKTAKKTAKKSTKRPAGASKLSRLVKRVKTVKKILRRPQKAKDAKPAAEEKHVVVLHGLIVNKYFMAGISSHLEKQGYTVHSMSYPTRGKSFDKLLDEHIVPVIDKIPAKKVDFVVHSMGGLMVRMYALKYGVEKIGRVVMIGTPNHGSPVADFVSRWPAFRWYLGEASKSLRADRDGIHAQLPPVNFECGVIAGDNHWFRAASSAIVPDLSQLNDGVVSIESTKVEGMKEHTVVSGDHSQMVWMPRVWKLASAFLKTGSFTT